MTTLKQQIDSDVAAVFHNEDEFAETWNYWPKNGAKRSAIVGTIAEERIEVEEMGTGKREVEVLDVFFANDSSTGIDAPRVGETFERLAETDTPRRKFKLANVPQRDDAGFLVTIQRPTQTRGGHAQTRTFNV